MLRPRRLLGSPLKLAVILTTLVVLYYLGPSLYTRLDTSGSREGAPPPPAATTPAGAAGRVKIPNGAPGAAQRAHQLDLDAERKRFADAKAREREQAGRKPVPAGDGDDEDDDDNDDDPIARMGGGAQRWAAADEARRRAQREHAERERGRDAAADREREMDRLRAAKPPKADDEQPQPKAMRVPVPWAAKQQPKPAPQRPPPPPVLVDPLRPEKPLRMAKEPQRVPAVVPKAAADDDDDEEVAAPRHQNIYEEEIEALANRRARQGARVQEWDDRLAAAEGGNRQDAGVDLDQDDLDGVQKGVAAQRGAAAAGRKKGPLIQVGGARNAAGDDKGGRVAPVRDRGDTNRAGKGWDQRFKRPAAAAAALVKDDIADVDSRDGADEEAEDPTAFERSAEADDHQQEDGISDHHLVRRIAAYDFVSMQTPLLDDEDSALEESLRAGATTSGEESANRRFNLTVCAFIPHEKRFLGEWLLYHRLLGVERFALYDTAHPGVFGAAEIDELIDKMKGESGEGELAPTIEELKAHVGTANSDLGGLDERGEIRKEKIAGFERWIDQGVAKIHWMNFGNAREARDPHAAMLEHCVDNFGSTSEWLAQLDVDEFLSLAPSDSASDAPSAESGTVRYPLLDLLASRDLDDAACVPLPLLNYRNHGVRELPYAQGLLETQVRRDVIKESKTGLDSTRNHQRILLHTACSDEPTVTFSGAHSCLVSAARDDTSASSRSAIRSSDGKILQDGGRYKAVSIPTEPLAVAHYVQRDLRDCFAKLSSLADPNDLHPRSRGMLSCEEHYIPTPEEIEALPHNQQNRFLLRRPPSDSIVLDRRVADCWAARATREIRRRWQAARDKLGRGPGQGGDHDQVPRDIVDRARRKVEVVQLKSRPRVDPDEDEDV